MAQYGGRNDTLSILLERLDDVQLQIDRQAREMEQERAAVRDGPIAAKWPFSCLPH